jgi:hypothetical protein
MGTAWEKGERLAKLVAHRRTLLVLDGLEPLQNPPGPQEGRLREPSAELHRLRGVFLAALGADESQIEASFCEAIRIAKEQKSISLGKRAEGTYGEYRRQKASGSGGRGLRLPLC